MYTDRFKKIIIFNILQIIKENKKDFLNFNHIISFKLFSNFFFSLYHHCKILFVIQSIPKIVLNRKYHITGNTVYENTVNYCKPKIPPALQLASDFLFLLKNMFFRNNSYISQNKPNSITIVFRQIKENFLHTTMA